MSACQAAEDRLRELDCRQPNGSPWWQTPAGTPFAEACDRAMLDGRDWQPECIAFLPTCDQLEAAYKGNLCLRE